MTPERANDLGYLLDNFEECAVAAHAEQTDSADERLRGAAKAITSLVERLTAKCDALRSALQIADGTTGRRTAERDQARAALTELRSQYNTLLEDAERFRNLARTAAAERDDALITIRALVGHLEPSTPEFELDPIIEAAELAVYTGHHADQCACNWWPEDCRTWPGGAKAVLCSVNAHDVVTAAAPLIERAVREQAAQELIAWAETHERSSSLRRHIGICARRIGPKMTDREVVEALQRGDFIGCHLDDAGRAIPPGERGTEAGQ